MIIRNLYFSVFLLLSSALALSGCVGAAVGIGTAAVAASSTEKGLSTSVSDGIIEAKLVDRFIQNDASLATNIKKSVNNGSVLFTGSVDTIEQKVLATKLAWEIKGVREVVNELQVTQDTSLRDTAKDLAATAQLRAALIGDSNVSSLNFSIDVVNGIVYLAGVASNETEKERVIAHAQELRFAKKVVNYIILETDKRD
ncbi:MAG: BON domain-containing protein [Alphaproteobacteria bacterium]|nr:BON domain-containing protein [Alphaproteobacteria bacterium]MBL6776316.1 BON domain-containing protein [Alphaproteobacteria bacterium]